MQRFDFLCQLFLMLLCASIIALMTLAIVNLVLTLLTFGGRNFMGW